MEYRYVIVLCEGQSEESFIKRVLSPYLIYHGIYVNPVILGGVSHYAGIRRELKRLGKNSSGNLTTMLDYYKLPQDFPGVATCNETEPCKIAAYIEDEVYKDLKNEISSITFFPYIQMHEYESLLFSDVSQFRNCQGMSKTMVNMLEKQVMEFESPEHVNNSEQTAPSKRILSIYPAYQKVSDGTMIAENIGIEKIMGKCLHFAEWVRKF